MNRLLTLDLLLNLCLGLDFSVRDYLLTPVPSEIKRSTEETECVLLFLSRDFFSGQREVRLGDWLASALPSPPNRNLYPVPLDKIWGQLSQHSFCEKC